MQSNGKHQSIPDPAEAGPRFISVKAAAALLDVSKLTIYRRFHAGLLPGRKIGRKIDLSAAFVAALVAELDAGRQVDVEAFAASWPGSCPVVA